jgi:predicted nucleic acid-binding protein
MQTILDSNVILDLIADRQEFRDWSAQWIDRCKQEGSLVINAVIFAEATAGMDNFRSASLLIDDIGLIHEEIPLEAAYRAGRAHQFYRSRRGIRERVLPDFLIGAHADVQRYRVLTRDAARYRGYFPKLDIIAPDTHP